MNYLTAENAINLLKSKNKSQAEKAERVYQNLTKGPPFRIIPGDYSRELSTIQVRFNNKHAMNDEHGLESRSFPEMLNLIKPALLKELGKMFDKQGYVKIQSKMHVILEKEKINEQGNKVKETKDFDFKSKQRVAVRSTIHSRLDRQMDEMKFLFEGIGDRVEGSNWKIKEYTSFVIDIWKIKPIRGAAYIPTPARFNNAKCGLINIRNEDNECFRWCMKYHQSEKKIHDQRVSALKKITDRFDYSDISFPTCLEDIERFEERNKVCVMVFIFNEQDQLVREHEGNQEYFEDTINLLRIEDDKNSHYVYIKNLGHLARIHTCSRTKGYVVCPCCLSSVSSEGLPGHMQRCFKFNKDGTVLKMPKKGSTMKFDKHRKMLKRQHVAYLDFEATLKKCPKPTEESKNALIAKHVPNSACILLDNATHPSKSRLWCEVSDDISLHIIEELSMMQEDMVKDININEKMCMTEANVLDF
jgi:hypothetical protein